MFKITKPRVFIVLFAVYSSQGFACKLTEDSSWNWSKDKLITETKTIVLAKVIDAKKSEGNGHLKGRGWNYKFETLEVIKGLTDREPLMLEDFQGPADGSTVVSSRTTYDPACLPAVGFQVGKTYLIFLNSFHRNGYDEIKSSEDPWLTQVKSVVRPKKPD
jgi:hypothetical protein